MYIKINKYYFVLKFTLFISKLLGPVVQRTIKLIQD